MYLKRVYHEDKLTRDSDGKVTSTAPGAVKGVRIMRADHGVQRLSPNFVAGGLAEGWISMGQGKLTIANHDGDDLAYRILRAPGIYCCTCEQKLGDCGEGSTPAGAAAMLKHVADAHGGKSPDPLHPAGYRQENYFTLVNEGDEVNTMTAEQAAAMDKSVRAALVQRLGEKHRRTNG